MKIERLKGKRTKQIILVSLVFIGIVVTLVLITSKAKYKNIQSIDLASGTINYTPADIDYVAINIKNDAGEYESTETIPTSGYVLSDTSYCNVNGKKDTNVNIIYKNGKIWIGNIGNKVKCYLYFDKISVSIAAIIGDASNIEEKTIFKGSAQNGAAGPATASDTGIYSAPDDYGTSYYFRGLEGSLNNWVKFGGFYWRIIRINGNGTVRMIYSGVANGNLSSSNKTGTTTQIGTSMYNHTYNDNAYIGYMMGIPLNGTEQVKNGNTTSNNSVSYDIAHANNYDSDAKMQVDSWYASNIANNENYAKHVDVNTGFCNDRQIASGHSVYPGGGYGTERTVYKPADRIVGIYLSDVETTQIPTLQCKDKTQDLFTVNNINTENIGNKKLTYPVGLITSDEVVFAGGFGKRENKTYYLYTNQDYWTMSPYEGFTSAVVFNVGGYSGILDGGNSVQAVKGLRPVINLRADTEFTGSGSATDPYIVS